MYLIEKKNRILRLFLTIAATFLAIILFNIPVRAEESEATEITPDITLSNGGRVSSMTDGSYNTRTSFSSGDTIVITSSEAMYSLYIKWDLVPSQWTLTYNDKTVTCGTDGFLHEYIEIPEGTTSMTITFASKEAICDLHTYSSGTAPAQVQTWKKPCYKADILVFATHADDEILFLGGVLATYGGGQDLAVQVAYMCEFTSTAKIREHEKLDGLWVSGIKNYPVCGDFPDLYSTTLEAAKKQYNYEDLKSFITGTIRRFKPLVVVTQDFNGEYGHGGHMILSKAVADSVDTSKDASVYPETASQYGTWDVPKTYIHLYDQNKITMNLRVPLANMGNRTAIEIASEAYKQHVSQQWCWFYVSDDYEYSCADFGLYRTLVGNDTGNDMLENITTYEEQERLAREAAEKESIESSIAASVAEEQSIAEEQSRSAKEQSAKSHKSSVIVAIAIIFVLLLAAFLIYKYYTLVQSRKRHSSHRRRKR
ncbi:MAG: PIG-L family deacetylase [Lachnospira sp.]